MGNYFSCLTGGQVWGGALYINREVMELRFREAMTRRYQEEIEEQEQLDRQLLDLGLTVPLPEVLPPPHLQVELELDEHYWGRSQIMTEESIPVRISTYLLLIRNKKHENISLSLNNDLKQLLFLWRVLKWPFWPSRRGGLQLLILVGGSWWGLLTFI